MENNKSITIRFSKSQKDEIIKDYSIAKISRECSLLGRREVLTGKAKFGIFGDGKEVPQLAWAKAFQKGDFRSGYYRDQTFMMAIGQLTIEQFFAGLFGHVDLEYDPMSGGRQMGGHFATHSIDQDGNWNRLTEQKNSSGDISPTAGQMPRLLGLAEASKYYRAFPEVDKDNQFSIKGNEVAWGTIGNASSSEGLFFETINAGGVLQVPMVVSVWDDQYGISVHAKDHTTKEDISEILKGFQRDEHKNGYEILRVKGWDYSTLVGTYAKAAQIAREEHVPVLIHVQELTQPQGHSTSGSHERYKSKERLAWEAEHDCLFQMRNWMINANIITLEELNVLDEELKKQVLDGKKRAWENYLKPIIREKEDLIRVLELVATRSSYKEFIEKNIHNLRMLKQPIRRDILVIARQVLYVVTPEEKNRVKLGQFIINYIQSIQPKYSSHLMSESKRKAIYIKEVKPVYTQTSKEVDARIVLRENFDHLLKQYNNVMIFGQDSGNIGDVNQALEGLQLKYGRDRVADAGIREATILGQGIGMAMRGLRPIAEIQYLDYLLYVIQIMSDDLATLEYRTVGRQKAPLIVRTRGHRLEGIWHSGSPMGMIINAIRGIHVLVPRNMTKAAGFYNTLMECDEPALLVECLNGYRLKEKMPDNLTEIRTPIGVVEVLREGKDITIVSYGSLIRIIEQAADQLEKIGIEVEIIDVQSLLPFDINCDIVESLKKTNRLLVVDEDVPGGASAFILQKIIEEQNAFQYLDSPPKTLTSKEHRPAYGTDGDYFSKPQVEDVYEKVHEILHEVNPFKFPSFY
ncbi:transketolase [Myroides marinus]|uniref:3-methyl-2-oxobutanoate dehydrogenase (2-methylpropanoyl-transferring) n=1 Tax=Myroides marinus TaxID=703342 RepID=A0A161S2C8_9FLAO|nr:alpha-ketoacid dehydrogenase subunit alpha/beta [Myroides marinus]KZE78439.1 transketolase [Myroides marinus]MDM1348194.1 transketolase [Myroides marinus]MDM1352050.1 transketolase [Myroides marinus]MDM1359264.1 transketolase [Myroides marinus]MDM1366797.1 transketolase [Myroides marinus]